MDSRSRQLDACGWLATAPAHGRERACGRTVDTTGTVKIQIRGRSIRWTKHLRAQVERRLGFALCRFGERISRVTLRFSDARSKRAMVDKRCQIDVELRPQTLRVEH